MSQNIADQIDDTLGGLADALLGLKEVSGGQSESLGILGGLGLAASEVTQQATTERDLF